MDWQPFYVILSETKNLRQIQDLKYSKTLVRISTNININGIYCGSTEIIATVEDGENDFYTYELSLPDGVRYSSVEKIDFYVEVDQPGNSTIHDTDVVKVTCNTSKRVFSAKY